VSAICDRTEVEPGESAPPAKIAVEVDRRRFLTFLVAAPTLAVAAEIGIQSANPGVANAVTPSPPQPADLYDLYDLYDLGDYLIHAATPTANLIVVSVDESGRVGFALHSDRERLPLRQLLPDPTGDQAGRRKYVIVGTGFRSRTLCA